MSDTNTQGRAVAIEDRINKDIAGSMGLTVGGGVGFRHMGDVMEFAKLMAISGPAVRPYLRNNPGACLGVIQTALSLGFEPFSFARKVYFVNDEMAYESQLVHAIILAKAPLKRRPKISFSGEGDTRKCKVVFEFLTGEVEEYESPEIKGLIPPPKAKDDRDPRNAGQPVKRESGGSPLWIKEPDQQLAYYSVRGAARRFCPDVILGMYTPEEREFRTIDADYTEVARVDERKDFTANGGQKTQATYVEHAADTTRKGNPVNGRNEHGDADQGSPVQADEPAAGTQDPAEAETAQEADPAPLAALTPDEDRLLTEVRKALTEAGTAEEVSVIADEFAGAIGMARPVVALEIKGAINDKAASFAPKAKRTAGKIKPAGGLL